MAVAGAAKKRQDKRGKIKKSLSDERLLELISQGKSDIQIAKITGYHRKTIWKRRTALQKKTPGTITQERVDVLVERQLSDLERLEETVEIARVVLLDIKRQLQHNPTNQTAIDNLTKINADIRGYVNTKANVAKAIAGLEAIQNFIHIVLTEMGDVDPNLRNRIIARLNRRRLPSTAISGIGPRT